MLDRRVAGTGSVNCRRETVVSPNMWGPLAANGRAAKGERRKRPPTASPSKNEGELDLHTKPRRVAVTDLSEESAFGAGRNASAV